MSTLGTNLDRLARLDRERREALGPDLTEAALKDRFPDEYRSWETVTRRCRREPEKNVLAPEFRTCAGFIQALGPRPSREHSVDRIDPDDPVYGPGRVQWATPRQQAINRRNMLRHPVTREVIPFQVLAERHGISERTLRRWRDAGWSDAELIAGYECPSLARLAERPAQPAQAPAAAVADQPAQPQSRAWPELPRFDRYWADLHEQMMVMPLAELHKFSPWDGEPDRSQLEDAYLRYAASDESRFAYALRKAEAALREYERRSRWLDEQLPQPQHEDDEPELTDRQRRFADMLANDIGPKVDYFQNLVMRRRAQLRAWEIAVKRVEERGGATRRTPPRQRSAYDGDDD